MCFPFRIPVDETKQTTKQTGPPHPFPSRTPPTDFSTHVFYVLRFMYMSPYMHAYVPAACVFPYPWLSRALSATCMTCGAVARTLHQCTTVNSVSVLAISLPSEMGATGWPGTTVCVTSTSEALLCCCTLSELCKQVVLHVSFFLPCYNAACLSRITS